MSRYHICCTRVLLEPGPSCLDREGGWRMSPDPHRRNKISIAAGWLSREAAPPSPIVPHMRWQFGLSPAEAIEAIRAADVLRVGRPA